MAVTSTKNKKIYTGDNSTDTYAYDYKIYANTDLVLEQDDVELELTTDYTVTGVGDTEGGNIVLVAGNLGTGVTLVIRRVMPLTQGLDMEENDEFSQQNLEDAIDKLTFQSQQQQEQLDRSLKASSSFTGTNPTYPSADSGKALVWNATGDGFDNSTYDPDQAQVDSAANVVLTNIDAASTAADVVTMTALVDTITVSATEPSSPSNGDIWVDIS